ncbi:uncharacterized protein LOC119093121 [Pollicipes pollicipes]|uniref:uncharacterized protein LOC119093121 n=1 Tax=Pollicipes pollicipes TaxID=41117 RepID=UPI00188537BA|nr:uncharacterized protein LOC119093121 [Pollicipes pollicipes]
MTEQDWERWRRLLPTRKGRPRKYPRPDDLLLIEQLKAGRRLPADSATYRELQHSHAAAPRTPTSRPMDDLERASSTDSEPEPEEDVSEAEPELEQKPGPHSELELEPEEDVSGAEPELEPKPELKSALELEPGEDVSEAEPAAGHGPPPAWPATARPAGARRPAGAPTDPYGRQYVTSRSGAAGGATYRQLMGLRGARRPAAVRLLQAGRRALKAARRHTARAGTGATAEMNVEAAVEMWNVPAAVQAEASVDDEPDPFRPAERQLKQELLDDLWKEEVTVEAGLEQGQDLSGASGTGLVDVTSDGSDVALSPPAENGDAAGAGSEEGDAFLLAQCVDVVPDSPAAAKASRRTPTEQPAAGDPYAKTYHTGASRRRDRGS